MAIEATKAMQAADRIWVAMGWEPEDVMTDGPNRVSLTAAQVDALMELVEPALLRAAADAQRGGA